MTVFKIKENGFNEFKKDLYKRTGIFSVFMLIVLILLSFQGGGREDLIVFLLMLPTVGIALGIGFFLGINRQKKIFESYTLTINDQEIIREQLNTPTISIPFADIKSIDKNSKGFSIRSMASKNIIKIPTQIDNMRQLEGILSEIQPIGDTVEKTFVEKNTNLISIVSLVSIMAVYISNNKLVVGICGVFVILLLGYSFYEFQTNKNIDSKTKNTSWIILLVLVSISAKIYAVLVS